MRTGVISMKRHISMWRVFPIAMAALIFGVAPAGWAGDDDGDSDSDSDEEIPYDEAELFFELNDTDGDLGIHSLIDGDAWKKLVIEDPHERKMLSVRAKGRLKRQGLTELFFESAEPVFESDDPDEVTLTPEQFFRRFPAGIYEVEGVTLEGEELESEVEVTQVMPAPAAGITVNGMDAAEDCDAEPLPEVASGPVTVDWDPVTTSHPDLGESDPDIEIDGYQFVAEYEDEDENEEVFSVDLPPSVTEMEIPAGFIALSDEFKFEILTREASGNQTAIESCFVLEE